VKPDEVILWKALKAGEQPRDAGVRFGIPPKRVTYICEKWAGKGWYDYGVVADRGWLTPKGEAAFLIGDRGPERIDMLPGGNP
jgi:hypothetical protein